MSDFEEPVRERVEGLGADLEDRERHPAFAQISFSRVQGTPAALYGSPLDGHHSYVQVRIQRSELRHKLGSDRTYATTLLAELDMSHVQFAEAITSMNVGDGVPCTLRFLAGEGHVARIPPDAHRTEAERVARDFELSQGEWLERLRGLLDRAREALENSRTSAKARERIEDALDLVFREVVLNRPFAVEAYVRAAARVAAATRAEVDAFVTGVVTRLGLDALREHVRTPTLGLPPAPERAGDPEVPGTNADAPPALPGRRRRR